jgi:hypothetical protein
LLPNRPDKDFPTGSTSSLITQLLRCLQRQKAVDYGQVTVEMTGAADAVASV